MSIMYLVWLLHYSSVFLYSPNVVQFLLVADYIEHNHFSPIGQSLCVVVCLLLSSLQVTVDCKDFFIFIFVRKTPYKHKMH